MSMFGEQIRRLRKEKRLTLEQVARKVGTHKGYVSGIETGKVRPPSVKLIRKLAKVFGQDEKSLVRMAWVDKAPPLIRDEALEFLKWCESRPPQP
jgi:transcriptional regulator with XRE-family HTH domain